MLTCPVLWAIGFCLCTRTMACTSPSLVFKTSKSVPDDGLGPCKGDLATYITQCTSSHQQLQPESIPEGAAACVLAVLISCAATHCTRDRDGVHPGALGLRIPATWQRTRGGAHFQTHAQGRRADPPSSVALAMPLLALFEPTAESREAALAQGMLLVGACGLSRPAAEGLPPALNSVLILLIQGAGQQH